MKKSEKYYNKKIKEYNKQKTILSKKNNTLAALRVLIAGGIGYSIYTLYQLEKYLLLAITVLFSSIVFTIIAIYHGVQKRKVKRLNILIDINKQGLKRLNGDWRNFEDDGEEYIEENHSFSNDLDIFGKNSLFQWINSTITFLGRERLVSILRLKKINNDINAKQQAIKELSKEVSWKQNLIADASMVKDDIKDVEDIILWSKTPMKINFTIKYIPYVFLAITYSTIILYIMGRVPLSLITLVLLLNFIAIKYLTKDFEKEIELFCKEKKNINAYSVILEYIENKEFESQYLKDIKANLNNHSYSCAKEMKELKNLLDWIGDSKKNAYYFILNILTFSDVFIIYNLEKWRSNNCNKINIWFDTIAEFEALISISNIAYENEEWSYPVIDDNYVFEGQLVGHPLLNNSAKVNNFKLAQNNICLITGSNMSGKSTFLRTIGINMILSYIGAPVRGKNVKCGVFHIYTCMRTKDNLEERISSFYAEIMRIKKIVEAVKNGEKVFFLLDEIFKGTNSEDRHIGAKFLIKQLYDSGAVGLVSTHDLELCDLEKEYNWIKNYNFREYYENNEIKFDYLLRQGKSETRNAVHLMRLAGIKID